jgi:hypothetical protein
VLDGSGGDDVTFSGIESFTLIGGGAGIFNLTTGGGDDVLVGGGGDDLLNSGAGVNVVDGGAGVDRWGADMSAATTDIVVDLGATGGSTFLGFGSAVNVENFGAFSTGSGNDRITSTALGSFAETVNAGAGDDIVALFGRGGDIVNAGDGSDRLSHHVQRCGEHQRQRRRVVRRLRRRATAACWTAAAATTSCSPASSPSP